MDRPEGHYPARIISDGRLTVPQEFRNEHDLEKGDRVWVRVEPVDKDQAPNWIMSD